MLPFWVQLRPNLKKFERLLLDCGRCSQHVERLFAQASSIARERGQVRQPTAEAVYRQSVDGLLAGRFLRADSERVPETPCWCAAAAAGSSSSNNSGTSAGRIRRSMHNNTCAFTRPAW